MHPIFHFAHVEQTQLLGTHSQGSFHCSQLEQGGQSFKMSVIKLAKGTKTTYMVVGAYRPQLYIQPVKWGHTSRLPVSQSCLSKISSDSLTAFHLGHPSHLLGSLLLTVRALARPDLFPFLSLFSLYGLSYCMPELTLLISYCALS